MKLTGVLNLSHQYKYIRFTKMHLRPHHSIDLKNRRKEKTYLNLIVLRYV